MVQNTTDHDLSFCVATFSSSTFDDTLTVQGIYNNMVITGGTGCFFGASGSVVGNKRGGRGSAFGYTIDFQFPGDATDPSCPSDLFDNSWAVLGSDTDVLYRRPDVKRAADAIVFDNNEVGIPTLAGMGVEAGRCFFLEDDAADLFCNIVFSLDGIGQIALQGFFSDMAIVGGNGCFAGLKGRVFGDDELSPILFYNWEISG